MRAIPGLASLHLVLLLAGACAPRSTLAQARPDSVHHRNDCRLAAQVVTAGHPRPRLAWATNIMRTCRDGGGPIAQAFSANRHSTDTTYLNALTHPAIALRDGRLFETAIAIASDRRASLQARVYAIRTLIWSMYPGGGIGYTDLVDTPGRERNCGGGPSTHTVVTFGSPMPANYVDRARSVANHLMSDTTEPFALRRAAVCLAGVRPYEGPIHSGGVGTH
jgi:hypothetical protein